MDSIKAYISAGSNIGDKEKNLQGALNNLEPTVRIVQVSPFFETEPVGYADQPWFLNMAVEIKTRLTPHGLLQHCMKIEKTFGRTRLFPNAPRTLDLDILFYGDIIVEETDLVIPHPRLTDRRFVLEPLSRIAPDFVHPLLHKPVRILLKECRDTSWVRLHR